MPREVGIFLILQACCVVICTQVSLFFFEVIFISSHFWAIILIVEKGEGHVLQSNVYVWWIFSFFFSGG